MFRCKSLEAKGVEVAFFALGGDKKRASTQEAQKAQQQESGGQQ